MKTKYYVAKSAALADARKLEAHTEILLREIRTTILYPTSKTQTKSPNDSPN